MHTRLKELRKELGMSQMEMGTKLNLSRNHISSLENGSRNITERTIQDICAKFNVNRDWLVEGVGECFVSLTASYPNLDPEVRELVEKISTLDPATKKHVLGLIDKILKE